MTSIFIKKSSVNLTRLIPPKQEIRCYSMINEAVLLLFVLLYCVVQTPELKRINWNSQSSSLYPRQ